MKVTVVERRQVWLVQPFNNGKDCGVNESDVRIGILLTEISNSLIVAQQQVLDAVRASDYVVKKIDHGLYSPSRVRKVIHLAENRSRNNAKFRRTENQLAALDVIFIIPIEQGNERAGVKY